MKLGLISAAAALVFSAGLALAQDIHSPQIKREGDGARRTALSAMELKPFPAGAWANLSDWTGGSAVTNESIRGKAVMIFTFQCWNVNSKQTIEKYKKFIDANPDLMVIAVHDNKKFDDAKAMIAENGLKVVLARDTADNKFRKALKADVDPDTYLIDKSGNMRFADVDAGSVGDAVAIIAAETPEQAAAAPKAFKDGIELAKKEAAKPKKITDISSMKVPFSPPDSSVYEKAPWPIKTKAEELGATDLQGQKLPNAATFGTKEIWVSPKPDWNGKVIVLDFWATWCLPCKMAIPTLEDMAKKNRDDLVVIGIGGQSEDLRTFETWLKGKSHAYAQCFDETQTLAKAIGIQGIPHCVVVSTDGTVRWQGNPLSPNFRKTVETVIEVDPGVANRRKAEAEALKRASATNAAPK